MKEEYKPRHAKPGHKEFYIVEDNPDAGLSIQDIFDRLFMIEKEKEGNENE